MNRPRFTTALEVILGSLLLVGWPLALVALLPEVLSIILIVFAIFGYVWLVLAQSGPHKNLAARSTAQLVWRFGSSNSHGTVFDLPVLAAEHR